jgi:hypothetical protein
MSPATDQVAWQQFLDTIDRMIGDVLARITDYPVNRGDELLPSHFLNSTTSSATTT